MCCLGRDLEHYPKCTASAAACSAIDIPYLVQDDARLGIAPVETAKRVEQFLTPLSVSMNQFEDDSAVICAPTEGRAVEVPDRVKAEAVIQWLTAILAVETMDHLLRPPVLRWRKLKHCAIVVLPPCPHSVHVALSVESQFS